MDGWIEVELVGGPYDGGSRHVPPDFPVGAEFRTADSDHVSDCGRYVCLSNYRFGGDRRLHWDPRKDERAMERK